MFVFSEDVDKEDLGKKYFARSFTNESWKEFSEDYLDDYSEREKPNIEFNVDFAWSGWSCIMEGYPNGKECVTLEWACKEFNVGVEISTEETSMGFEEKIIADRNGVKYECVDIPLYECCCGNKEGIPSGCDLDEYECSECGRVGEWGDKLKKLLEKKMEN